jgi:hypothetical protein
MDKEDIKALRAELQAHRQRLLDEKVEAGKVVRLPPLIVGSEAEIEAAKAREIEKLRAAGDKRTVIFGDDQVEVIITGVPKAAHVPDLVSEPNKESRHHRRPQGEVLRLTEGDPLRATFAPPPPESEPSEKKPIWVQTEAPSENNPGGTIAEGFERHTNTRVQVYDTAGNLLGSASLQPGDDVEATARRILREKRGNRDFNAPLQYPPRRYH